MNLSGLVQSLKRGGIILLLGQLDRLEELGAGFLAVGVFGGHVRRRLYADQEQCEKIGLARQRLDLGRQFGAVELGLKPALFFGEFLDSLGVKLTGLVQIAGVFFDACQPEQRVRVFLLDGFRGAFPLRF